MIKWTCECCWYVILGILYILLNYEYMNIGDFMGLWIREYWWIDEYVHIGQLVKKSRVLVKLTLGIQGCIFVEMWILMYIWILYVGEYLNMRSMENIGFRDWNWV